MRVMSNIIKCLLKWCSIIIKVQPLSKKYTHHKKYTIYVFRQSNDSLTKNLFSISTKPSKLSYSVATESRILDIDDNIYG